MEKIKVWLRSLALIVIGVSFNIYLNIKGAVLYFEKVLDPQQTAILAFVFALGLVSLGMVYLFGMYVKGRNAIILSLIFGPILLFLSMEAYALI